MIDFYPSFNLHSVPPGQFLEKQWPYIYYTLILRMQWLEGGGLP